MTAAFSSVSAGLLVLWLLLNQTLSVGHVLLGSVIALVGGWALTALQPPEMRVGRPVAIVRLTAVVVADVIRSNIAVARIILTSVGENGIQGLLQFRLSSATLMA